MNMPIDAEFQDRFNVIIDGGTLEHIFDVKQAMTNINLMLKSGGRIIHLSPASNQIGHGFYSFSPELFFEYYSANGFVNLKAYIMVVPNNIKKAGAKLYEYRYDSYKGIENCFRSKSFLSTIFVAEKNDDSTYNRVPFQRQFSGSEKSAPNAILAQIYAMKHQMPANIWRIVRVIGGPALATARIVMNRWRKMAHRRSGGLKYIGKI